MNYLCQPLVTKTLSTEHKETRVTLAGDLITPAEQDVDFLHGIIVGDETWCFLFDPSLDVSHVRGSPNHLLGNKNSAWTRAKSWLL
jgi:hypothetical protein